MNGLDLCHGKVWTWLQNTINNVVNWGRDVSDKGKQGAQELFDKIINTIKELPDKVKEIGKNIVEGLWNGITGAGSWLKEKISSFATGIVEGMKQSLDIHSPSRVFRDEVGKYIALGVGEGFTDNIKSVYKQMKTAVDFQTQKLSANLSTTATFGRSITANINVNGDVDMDGTRVGRIVAPTVSKTLKTGGAFA